MLGGWKYAGRAMMLASLGLFLAACDRTSADANASRATESVDGAVAAGAASTAPANVASPEARCSSALRADADLGSFDRGTDSGAGATPEQIETLRAAAERQFRTVADRMCEAGQLRAEDLDSYLRLLIQNGGGADNVAIYADPDTVDRETLVFQYVFDQGEEAANLVLPPDEDLRGGLICWSRPEENEAMCRDREP